MPHVTPADHAPQAPPAPLLPVKPTHERDRPRLKTMAIGTGLGLLAVGFIVLLAVAAFLAVFVVLSAFAPS
jgi:hypothetical protein